MGSSQGKEKDNFSLNIEEHNRKMGSISNQYGHHRLEKTYTSSRGPKLVENSYSQIKRKIYIYKPTLSIRLEAGSILIEFDYEAYGNTLVKVFIDVHHV